MNTPLWAIEKGWSAWRGRSRLSILIYHRVLPAPDPMRPGEPDVRRFDRQMEILAHHTHVLPLPEAVARLEAGTLPPRATAVTFDDGYADNYHHALPILRRHGIPATFFIATGYLNDGWMFNDTVIEAVRWAPDGTLDLTPQGLGRHRLDDMAGRRRAAEAIIRAVKHLTPPVRNACVEAVTRHAGAPAPERLMMTDDEVRGLHEAGMTIGAHTVSHPILTLVDERQARWEIHESAERLRAICRAPVECFAYPNGKPGRDYTARDRSLLRQAGFRLAVSTAHGAAAPGRDPYQLPRFTPWDRAPWRFLIRLALNSGHDGALAHSGAHSGS